MGGLGGPRSSSVQLRTGPSVCCWRTVFSMQEDREGGGDAEELN